MIETFSERHPQTETTKPNREEDNGDKESVCDGGKQRVDGGATLDCDHKKAEREIREGGGKEDCDSKVKELDIGNDGGKGSVGC